MGSLIKYIIPLITLVIAFITEVDNPNSKTSDNQFYNIEIEVATYSSSSSNIESELCLPSQTLSYVAFRQNTVKRVNNTHRNNYNITEYENSYNIGFKSYTLNKSLISHIPFTKSNHRLISFGKLVI